MKKIKRIFGSFGKKKGGLKVELNKEKPNLEKELNGFINANKYYTHSTGLIYTDGVKYLADKAKAHWLINTIFNHKNDKCFNENSFQVWKLTLNEQGETILTMQASKNGPVLISQKWLYTDFPFQEFKNQKIELLLVNNMLIVPSEYSRKRLIIK